jgi:hypothetical protein
VVDEGSELCYVVQMVLRLVEKELEVMAGLLGEEDEWERGWKGRKGRRRVVEGVKVLVNVVRLFKSSEKREKSRWGKMEDLAKRVNSFPLFLLDCCSCGLTETLQTSQKGSSHTMVRPPASPTPRHPLLDPPPVSSAFTPLPPLTRLEKSWAWARSDRTRIRRL